MAKSATKTKSSIAHYFFAEEEKNAQHLAFLLNISETSLPPPPAKCQLLFICLWQ